MWLHTLHLPHTPWSGTRCPSVRAPNARWRRCVVSYWKSSVPTSLALRIDGWMCVTWLHHWRNLAAFVHSKTPISTSPQLEKYAKPKWWVFQKQQISIISRSRIGALKELIYILSLTFACFGGLDSPDSPTLTVSHSESFCPKKRCRRKPRRRKAWSRSRWRWKRATVSTSCRSGWVEFRQDPGTFRIREDLKSSDLVYGMVL